MTLSALERYRAASDAAIAATGVPEEQGGDYEAGRIQIDGAPWRIRTARITPTKPGAFVAVWRRGPDGSTEPFGDADDCAGLLVFVIDGPRFGVFRFTREHLRELGILSGSSSPGKRGFRLYPAWCTELNPQATRTQRAQAKAFTELAE